MLTFLSLVFLAKITVPLNLYINFKKEVFLIYTLELVLYLSDILFKKRAESNTRDQRVTYSTKDVK